MIKFRITNKKTFLRALAVGALAGLACGFAGLMVRNLLDTLWRLTDSDLYYGLYYTLSAAQSLVVAAVWVAVMLLFANWIFYPSYLAFSRTVAQSLQVRGAGDDTRVALPRAFRELEAELDNVSRELKLWQYAVQEAEQRKDDLVVYLAHDIRTPLTSVLGYLELLQELPDLPPEQRERFTATALRKAQRMQQLVEELFEVTRYNIGQIELRRQRVNLPMLLGQLLEEMAPVLRQRGLTTELKGEGGQVAFIDPEKMARALDNILHNAAHYAPEGGAITVRHSIGAAGGAVIQVANTGADISQTELDRYFEKFYRGDEARSTGTGGSGLGLAIARSIVEAHGGRISATSANQTITFTIEL